MTRKRKPFYSTGKIFITNEIVDAYTTDDSPKWRTKDGEIEISSMKTEHIKKALKKIQGVIGSLDSKMLTLMKVEEGLMMEMQNRGMNIRAFGAKSSIHRKSAEAELSVRRMIQYGKEKNEFYDDRLKVSVVNSKD